MLIHLFMYGAKLEHCGFKNKFAATEYWTRQIQPEPKKKKKEPGKKGWDHKLEKSGSFPPSLTWLPSSLHYEDN